MPRVGQERGGVTNHAGDRFSHDKQGVKPNRYGKHRAVAGAMMVVVMACPMTVAMAVTMAVPVIMPVGMAVFGGMAVIVAMIMLVIMGVPMIGFVVVACAHYFYP
jgi:hypothetical protein